MIYHNRQSGRQTLSRSTGSRFSTLSKGFSAVELLITLFIAAIFLITGFQLYAVIIKNGGEARQKASATNIVADYLQRYKSTATRPCTAKTPLPDSVPSPMPDGLSNVTISVTITCPYTLATSVSKIIVTIKYGNPQQTIINATYTKPEDGNIVTNGLVLNLDAGNVKSIKGRTSIINWNSWTVGTGAVSGYGLNGDGNSRIIDTNPWGASDVVWDVSNQDVASDDDGGWEGTSFPIDNTKMYRFTTWVKRKTIGNGNFYLGTRGYPDSVLNRSDAAVNGNPYFSDTGWWGWGYANQWYLVVGYVWPAGSGAGAVMPESGIYALNGTKVASTSDFVWQPTTTTSNHRSYLYYSTDVTTNQQWYQPRVDIVNGTEPTVTELRNNAGNTWYDLSGGGNNGTMLNGVGYTTANGEALSFDGVNQYISIANPTSSSLNFGNGDFSIEVWLKFPLAGSWVWNGIVSKGYTTGAPANTWGLITSNPATGLAYQDATNAGGAWNTYFGFSNLPSSGFHQIVVTRTNGTTYNFYVDGVLNGSQTSPQTATLTNASNLQIGNAAGRYLNSSISAIDIYNRALSATEVKQNFNALRGRYGL